MLTGVSGELTKIDVGVLPVRAGTEYFVMLNGEGAEAPPPGAPLTTATCTVVVEARSFAVSPTVIVVGLT